MHDKTICRVTVISRARPSRNLPISRVIHHVQFGLWAYGKLIQLDTHLSPNHKKYMRGLYIEEVSRGSVPPM